MKSELKNKFIDSLKTAITLREKMMSNEAFVSNVLKTVDLIVTAYKNDKKVLFAGNGGSAADAQHLAAELVGRFYYDRPALYAEALTANTSDLTCIGNDYGYDFVFSRGVDAKGRAGDVLFAISTSGNSANVVNAAKSAKAKKMIVIAMTGETGGRLSEYADVLLNVPSKDTARIQECHITLGHLICEFIESELFPK